VRKPIEIIFDPFHTRNTQRTQEMKLDDEIFTTTPQSQGASMKSFKSNSTMTPSSPTDSMLSPVSKRLLMRKSRSTDDSDANQKKIKMHLEDILRIPFPAPHLDLIFGTSSKYRKMIIDKLEWNYSQMSPDINGKFPVTSISFNFVDDSFVIIEKAIRTDDPIELPIKIAEAKAQAIIEQLKNANDTTEKLILTADQIVLFDQTIREKPESEKEAMEFLSSYRESSVSTVSAIAITHYPSGIQSSGFDIATIHWNDIPEDVIKKVVEEKEIFSCAGGFRIEDPLLQPYIHSIDGSFDSVLGLPIKLMVNLIMEVLSYRDDDRNPKLDDSF
jgi:septum formation protein